MESRGGSTVVSQASVVQQGPPKRIQHHVHIETRILSHQFSHLLRISTLDSSQHDQLPHKDRKVTRVVQLKRRRRTNNRGGSLDDEAGWSIAQGGFGVIASQNDQGWFGNGIYVSSSMRYAHQYAGRSASMAKKAPALLVCAISPGNSFPIIHRQDGRSVEDGYQSHYTVGEHSLSLSFDIQF